MGEITILHAADSRAFSCRLAAQLAAEGHSVLRRDAAALSALTGNETQSADSVIVVWSAAMLGAGAMIDAARRALSRRVLVPVSIGAVEPPGSFAHLWPIDLEGWNGEADDPRWQFVRDEVELAQRRNEARAQMSAQAPPRRPAAKRAPRLALPRLRLDRQKLPVRMILAGAVGLGAVAGAAALVVSFRAPPAIERARPAPIIAFIEPARATETRDVGKTAQEPLLEVPEVPVESVFAAENMRLAAADPDDAGSELPPMTSADTAPDPQPAAADEAGAAPEDIANDDGAANVEASVEIAASPLPAPSPDTFAGVVFRDCLDCPDMAEIPAGVFSMGAAEGEAGASPAEMPVRTVTIAQRFALSRREITFAEWDACVAAGGCRAYRPSDAAWGRADRPAINVSFEDARAYAEWLSARTGQRYRLPSEAEWEYAARAGASGPFSFGDAPTVGRANYEDAARARTVPVASFAPSAFGLYDMHGNVWEWVADCWRGGHADAPADGSAVGGDCDMRVIKGGAYNSSASRLRASHRLAKAETAREPDNGFRVARDLP